MQPPPTTLHAAIRHSFLQACTLDVAVRKPGNVSWASAGHRMQAQQFIASAQAAAGPLCAPGARVGPRIEAAVQASWAAAGCNTNLGIVLLCAPIAAAAERPGALAGGAALQSAIETVLEGLDLDDAACAFRAIAHANPGGLGTAEQQDVREPPALTLRQAMALAADRDLIARQYAQGYGDLFSLPWPALAPATAPQLAVAQAAPTAAAGPPAWPDAGLKRAVQQLFLAILGRWPDSHIVRKQGLAAAQNVSLQTRAWLVHPAPDSDPAFAAWDESLKNSGLNPGTTADLTVATLMLAGLLGFPAVLWHGS